ncbi:hypothetical protein N0A02_13870 [Paraburkholderia acidicola]|uniref:Uncharacterized protein n=1 Tax=Paraburkholderia acidicola TaxID=1912599 RepID=A0ABV1LMM8_9BURK
MIDRPKRSAVAWMTCSELGEYAVSATYVDKVAHITDRSTFAVLERQWADVCSSCLDELLVRSGEQPFAPTSREQAFDTSVVDKGAEEPEPSIIKCNIHGLVFAKRSSSRIAEAIQRGDTLLDAGLTKVLVASTAHESELWFDKAFLGQVLGSEIEIRVSTCRV